LKYYISQKDHEQLSFIVLAFLWYKVLNYIKTAICLNNTSLIIQNFVFFKKKFFQIKNYFEIKFFFKVEYKICCVDTIVKVFPDPVYP